MSDRNTEVPADPKIPSEVVPPKPIRPSVKDLLTEEMETPAVKDGLTIHCNSKHRPSLFLKRDDLKKIGTALEIIEKNPVHADLWQRYNEFLLDRKKGCDGSYDQIKTCLNRIVIDDSTALYNLGCDNMDLLGFSTFIVDKTTHNTAFDRKAALRAAQRAIDRTTPPFEKSKTDWWDKQYGDDWGWYGD